MGGPDLAPSWARPRSDRPEMRRNDWRCNPTISTTTTSSSTSNLSHPPSTSHCTTELAAHLIWSSQEIAAGRKSTNSSSNSSSSAPVGVGDGWARFQASQRSGPRLAISRHTPLRTPVKTTSNLSYTFDPGPQVKVPAFWMASWGMDSSNQSGSVWEFKKWLQRLLTSNYSMSSNTFWKCSLKGVKLKAAFAVEMSSWILFWMFLCPDWSTEKFKKFPLYEATFMRSRYFLLSRIASGQIIIITHTITHNANNNHQSYCRLW